MQLNDYQQLAQSFAKYKGMAIPEDLPIYASLKLAGEAGEVAEKVGKAIRDGVPENFRTELAKELGDVLWYIAAIAADLDYTLQEIAEINITKLSSRKKRGVLGGSGDNR